MLAYVFWHQPAEGVSRDAYERANERLHRSLRHSPPAGFRGSAGYRVSGLPWLQARESYEDWYLVEDFTALGVLNQAAVAHGHRTAHDEIASRFGAGAGALYSLLEGTPELSSPTAMWVSRPVGAAKGTLGELLADGIDPAHASLWRRALVLGPGPEYCLLVPAPPAGTMASRLPHDWRATMTRREEIWHG